MPGKTKPPVEMVFLDDDGNYSHSAGTYYLIPAIVVPGLTPEEAREKAHSVFTSIDGDIIEHFCRFYPKYAIRLVYESLKGETDG